MDILQNIKDQSLQIVESYIALTQINSTNWRSTCPFHDSNNNTTLSVVKMNNGKIIIKCFSEDCINSNIFAFVAKMENLDCSTQFKEVMKIAGSKVGITITDTNSGIGKTLINTENRKSHIFESNIFIPQNKFAIEYLKTRGITEEDIREHRIGLAEHGDLKGRVTFPYTKNSQILGFTARTLIDDPEKFKNSKQSQIFDKSELLWGLDHSQLAIQKTHEVTIVEGVMDFFAYKRIGIHTVSPVTDKISEGHAKTLHALFGDKLRVTLSLDGDEHGTLGTTKSAKELLKQQIYNISVVVYPSDVKDPGEFFEKGRMEELKKAHTQKISFTQWIADQYLKNCTNSGDTLQAITEAIKEVLPQKSEQQFPTLFLYAFFTDLANRSPLLPNGEEGATMIHDHWAVLHK